MEDLIHSYIKAYNQKDVTGMLAVLHDDILFENSSSAGGTMTLVGKKAFGEQAEQILPVFSMRKQGINKLII